MEKREPIAKHVKRISFASMNKMIPPANVLMDIMRTYYFPVSFAIIVAHCVSVDY
jgi:hypothetical protein